MPPDPESASLPEPPPPRPVARDAAIEAAMRRFDGAKQPLTIRPPAPLSRRPAFQLAVAASLVLMIGIPATLIGIREQSPNQPSAAAPKQADEASSAASVGAGPPTPSAAPAPRNEAPLPPEPTLQPRPEVAKVSNIAPVVAAPAAPPPASERGEAYAPPPPPAPAPAPMLAQKSADASANDIVVTGSRIPQPELTSPSPVTVVSGEAKELDRAGPAKDRGYAAFVQRLQSAVRKNDRSAILKLIRYPLRVNTNGQSRVYPDATSVRADFDNIFTPRVRQAILAQRTDRIFSRDVGAMIGDGAVWFDYTCANTRCSRLGPVRITAINP